jgi:hypothetical protein
MPQESACMPAGRTPASRLAVNAMLCWSVHATRRLRVPKMSALNQLSGHDTHVHQHGHMLRLQAYAAVGSVQCQPTVTTFDVPSSRSRATTVL